MGIRWQDHGDLGGIVKVMQKGKVTRVFATEGSELKMTRIKTEMEGVGPGNYTLQVVIFITVLSVSIKHCIELNLLVDSVHC